MDKGVVDSGTVAQIRLGVRGRCGQRLQDFQDQLRALGHYPSNYISAADLHLKFRDQIAQLRTGWGPA